MTPRPGDYFVVAYHKPDLFSKIISVTTKSRWTHAGIYLGDGVIAEAQPAGFTTAALSKYDGVADLAWSTDDLDPGQRAAIVTRALMGVEMHLPYGWLDVAAIGLAALGVRVEPVMARLRDRGTLFCSQAVAVAWLGAGIRLAPDGGETAEVTPALLADRIPGLTH